MNKCTGKQKHEINLTPQDGTQSGVIVYELLVCTKFRQDWQFQTGCWLLALHKAMSLRYPRTLWCCSAVTSAEPSSCQVFACCNTTKNSLATRGDTTSSNKLLHAQGSGVCSCSQRKKQSLQESSWLRGVERSPIFQEAKLVKQPDSESIRGLCTRSLRIGTCSSGSFILCRRDILPILRTF